MGPDAFDSLFLVMSGHGLNGSLVTRDHKLVSKVDIHRIFSGTKNPLSREIPRFFLFDCCDGHEDLKGIEKRGANANADANAAEAVEIEEEEVEQEVEVEADVEEEVAVEEDAEVEEKESVEVAEPEEE